MNTSLVEQIIRNRYQWEFDIRVYQNDIGDYSIHITCTNKNDVNEFTADNLCNIAQLYLLTERNKNYILSKIDDLMNTYIKSKTNTINPLLREIDESQIMSDGMGNNRNQFHCDCCGRKILFYQSDTYQSDTNCGECT